MRAVLLLFGLAACSSHPGSPPSPPDLASAGPLHLSVSNDDLQVSEGANSGFDLSLTGTGTGDGTLTVAIVSSNPASLPVTPGSFVFDAVRRSTHITVSAPVDANDIDEVATITITGDQVATVRVAAIVQDATAIEQYGSPSPFPSTLLMASGDVDCNPVHVDIASTLASLGVATPAATGDYRMALYGDDGGAPGLLLAELPRAALADGANVTAVPGDVAVPAGDAWVCVRFDHITDLGDSPGQMSVYCYRTIGIGDLDDDWPSPFGSSTCEADNALNLWMTGYHQR